jgi:fructose-1,6-bisphosphatase II
VATSEGQCVCGRFSSVTEGAALAAAEWTGRGDGLAADLAAREAMAAELAQMPFRARVVAGRGGNEAPNVLRLGDEVGGESDSQRAAGLLAGGAAGGYDYWDLAVVPLEGHAALAAGEDGAVAMIAAGPSGSLMSVPDMYMQKRVVPGEAAAVIDIEASVASNVSAVAAALGRRSSDLIVVVLDRPRHEELIAQIRRSGARLKLIADGDLSAGLAAAARDAGADMCIGIGGSTEGIMTAAALRCLGGEIQARFWPVSRHQVELLKAAGIEDVEAPLTTRDMAGDGVLFSATAVTAGRFLKAVDVRSDGVRTETLVLCSRCHAIRTIRTIHRSENGGPQVGLGVR